MDLIGDHHHIVLAADGSISRQLIFGPHSAHRVVRTAQNRELDLRVGGLALEVGKIHLIPVPFQQQGTGNYLPVIGADRIGEWMVDRPLNQDFVARRSKAANDDMQGSHYPRCQNDPLHIDGPVLAALHPTGDRRQVTVCFRGVTIKTAGCTARHRIDNGLGCGEVHVRDPHWQDLIVAMLWIGQVPVPESVFTDHKFPFDRIHPPVIDFLIKINVHP